MNRPGVDRPAPPLDARRMLATSLGLVVADLLGWWLIGYPGLVLLAALVVSLIVTASRHTRDVGISLVVAVLVAGFLVLALTTFVPRLEG